MARTYEEIVQALRKTTDVDEEIQLTIELAESIGYPVENLISTSIEKIDAYFLG